MRRMGPLLAWSIGLGTVVVVMVAAGRGALAPPPLAPGRWVAWALAVGPAAAALAVVRLVVLALAVYLVVATAVAVVAELVRGAVLIDLSELLALPVIRRAVHTAVGASLVGATVAGGAATVEGARPAVTASASPAALRGQPPTLEIVSRPPTTSTTSTTSTTTVGSAVPPAVVPQTVAPAPALPPATWAVAPGDHLWSIASRLLAAGWRRQPSEAEVVPYWQALVEANRPRLRDPGNADLVFPGDELLVPGLPSAPI